VNILSEEQKELSVHFAGQIKEEREVEFEWVNGLPVLKNALANIVCNVHSKQIAGDHTLFIGEVTDIEMSDGSPLAFFEGKYSKVSQPISL
jgi:flavin reductase (DIM6/NTAB) family NADH-FMN oxidoreductase RutF